MVTINPAMVLGRLLQPTLNTSSEAILTLLNGTSKTYPNAALGWVGVKDVVNAHILAYEDVGAFGRYLCVERVVHYSDIANLLSKMYPEYDVPTKCVDEVSPRAPVYDVSTEKLKKLGLRFQPLEEILKECVESLKERNFLQGNPKL
ncbi:hypothetical protein O6H91_14G050700 [Diphasiastrum complanatum]|nr:hypothetical protein O6H91_14G050700 [Diphasiastrum complanatum]